MTRPFSRGPTALGLVSLLLLISLLLLGCGGEDAPGPEEAPGEEPSLPSDPDSFPPDLDLDPPPDPVGVPPGDTGGLPPTIHPGDTAAPPPTARDPEAASDPVTEEGVVGVTGTDAWSIAVLRTDSRGHFGLTGDLEDELRRLSGLRIRVTGRPTGTAVGPGLSVTGYELLEVDGRLPYLGILERGADGEWTLDMDEDAILPLRGLPEGRLQEGMKIWVVGRLGSDDRLAVESYGIVAPPGG